MMSLGSVPWVILGTTLLLVVLSSNAVYRWWLPNLAPALVHVPAYSMSVSLRVAQPINQHNGFAVGNAQFIERANSLGVSGSCMAPNGVLPEIAACLQRLGELKVTQPIFVQLAPERWTGEAQGRLQFTYKLDPRSANENWVDLAQVKQHFLMFDVAIQGAANRIAGPRVAAENLPEATPADWNLVARFVTQAPDNYQFVAASAAEQSWLERLDLAVNHIRFEDMPAMMSVVEK